jgi:hypothetical protein
LSPGADDAAGHGEQAEAEAFGLPLACGLMPVEGQGLGPGDQTASQGNDFEPDPVRPVAVERQATEAGVP